MNFNKNNTPILPTPSKQQTSFIEVKNHPRRPGKLIRTVPKKTCSHTYETTNDTLDDGKWEECIFCGERMMTRTPPFNQWLFNK